MKDCLTVCIEFLYTHIRTHAIKWLLFFVIIHMLISDDVIPQLGVFQRVMKMLREELYGELGQQ